MFMKLGTHVFARNSKIFMEGTSGYFTSLLRYSTSGCLLSKVKRDRSKPVICLVVDESIQTKLKLLLKNLRLTMMNSDELHPSLRPPDCVQGMTTLAKDKFKKSVKVPGIKLPKKQISSTQKNWKPLLMKLRGLKPVASLDEGDPLKDSHNLILLDPGKLHTSSKEAESLQLQGLRTLGFSPESLEKYELEIGYENWSVSDVLRAILPQDADNVSSFTQIGHIAHLNLREENLPYKEIIGEVIIDKISSVKTVVNKLNSIDNTYRNFEMELLAGEDNYITQTREHNCVFEFDFSKVYWNSRLSTEHHRVVEFIPKGSVVYDVFAGVGPFTVPLGKKKNCIIFANDLNPHSYSALEKNISLNKLKTGLVQTHNMDGRDFVKKIVKHDLTQRIETSYKRHVVLDQECADSKPPSIDLCKKEMSKTFVVMNLPALAIDFLDAFISLLTDLPSKFHDPKMIDPVLPTIYCYAFSTKTDDIEVEVKRRAESVLCTSLPSDATVRIVRNVAPSKEMVCLSFKLWPELVLAAVKSPKKEEDGPECKKPKLL